MTRVRGIRGATTTVSNSEEAVVEAVAELLARLVDGNGIAVDDVAAVIFSATDDVDSVYPAAVARKVLGWEYVPLLDVQQMKASEGVDLCIRVLMLVNTDKKPEELEHAYLRGASDLRK